MLVEFFWILLWKIVDFIIKLFSLTLGHLYKFKYDETVDVDLNDFVANNNVYYELARFDNNFEEPENRGSAKYSFVEDSENEIKLINTEYNKTTNLTENNIYKKERRPFRNNKNPITGTGILFGRGKLLIRFDGNLPFYAPYYIIGFEKYKSNFNNESKDVNNLIVSDPTQTFFWLLTTNKNFKEAYNHAINSELTKEVLPKYLENDKCLIFPVDNIIFD